MTVANNYKPIKQVGNGNTTSFSFDFPVITESEVEVYQNIDGVESLVDNNSYTITLNSNGGVVNFKTAPAQGITIAIVRNVDLTQETPFLTSSGFPADRVEDCFDKLTMITQQQQQVLDRCVKVVVTDNQTPEELLEEVYNKLDSANEISAQAQKAADDAFDALEETNKTLTETKAYATNAKADIGNARDEAVGVVNSGVETINNAVSKAKTDVTNIVDDAEENLTNTINKAVGDVTDRVENNILPTLQVYVDNASQSASEARTSENNAKISETNAKASENSCKDILERLGTVIKIKGRVNSESDLPTSGNLNGDVYLVGAEGLESYPEYYWFDDHWEFIGTSSNKMEWGTL